DFISYTWPTFTWYKCWLVAHSQTDTFDAWVQGGTSGPFVNQTLIGSNLPFNNTNGYLSTMPLRSFNISHGGFFHDIYVDGSGDAHLIDPTPEPNSLAVIAAAGVILRMRRGARTPTR